MPAQRENVHESDGKGSGRAARDGGRRHRREFAAKPLASTSKNSEPGMGDNEPSQKP